MADKTTTSTTAKASTTTSASSDVKKETGNVQVTVDVGTSAHSLSKTFLSMAAGAKLTQRMNVWQFDTGSEKVQNLAKALAPCELRIGGAYTKSVLFSPDGTRENLLDPAAVDHYVYGFCCNFWDDALGGEVGQEHTLLQKDQWDSLNTFLQNVGWGLIWDFNNMTIKDGAWDTTNATLLLNYSAEQGYKIAGFQLGNEPDSTSGEAAVSPEALAQDVKTLKELLAKYPLYKDSKVMGPAVSQKGVPGYFEKFLSAGGKDHVSCASFQHYSSPAKDAAAVECTCVGIFDQFSDLVKQTTTLTVDNFPGLPVLLSEAGAFCNGGAAGVSDRYCSGFLWLDKLGQSAKNGITQVFRSSFWGANNGVLKSTTLDPNSDYFLCLLFKRLVEGAVFEVTSTPENHDLRLYANSARTDSCYAYPEGSLVLYYVNVGKNDVNLALTQFGAKKVDLFILTNGEGGLDSTEVQLNGTTLKMAGNEVPSLDAKSHTGDVTVPEQSFGFIVIPGAYSSTGSGSSVTRTINK